MKLDVKTLDDKSVGSVDLDEKIFGLDPRADILHRCVRYQLAKRQAGTHATLGRSDVRGTTKKFVKQKALAVHVMVIKRFHNSAVVRKHLVQAHVAMLMT